jgi:hypothetical protein
MIYDDRVGQRPIGEGFSPGAAVLVEEREVEDFFSEGEVLRHRLRASATLLTVLAEQTEAMERGDAEGASRLNQRRRQIEREVAHATVGRMQDGLPLDPAVQINRLLDQALAFLETRSEKEQRIRDWMEAAQDALLVRLCDEHDGRGGEALNMQLRKDGVE